MGTDPVMRVVRRFGLILALLVVTACGEDEAARQEMDAGIRAFADGNFAKAQAHFEAAENAGGTTPETLFARGVAAYAAHDNAAADRYFTEALETAPSELRALVHYNVGAVRYRQAVNAVMSFLNADAYLREAIEQYRDALTIDPTFEDAAYNLELALRLQDELARRLLVTAGSEGMAEGEARTDEGVETPEGMDPGDVKAAQPQASDGESSARQGGDPGEGGREAGQATGADQAQKIDVASATAREMTAQEAEELIEMVQGQPGIKSERASNREARMRAGGDVPTW